MVDYSRATVSKNSKESFDKAANNIIEYIKELQAKYETTWSELESLRKERAAIIEHIIQILKNNNIKLTKPLSRCNNEEINEELLKVIGNLSFYEREEIQVAIVKINNRYQEIIKMGKELDELNEELSNTRVLEADSKDEVVISLSDYKNKKTNLEKVERISKASDELIKQLEELVESKRTVNKLEESIEDEVNFIEALNSEELEELYESSKETDDYEIGKILDVSPIELSEQLDDFVTYTIKDNQTLAAIALNVYGNKSYWQAIYNYKDNKVKIDSKIAEHKVSLETAVDTIGILTNLKLQFPTELVISKETEERKLGKVA